MIQSQEKCPKIDQMVPKFSKITTNPVDLNSAKSLKSSKIARTQLIEIK